jgi:hypothetical protein
MTNINFGNSTKNLNHYRIRTLMCLIRSRDIYIRRERELGYGATRSMNDPCIRTVSPSLKFKLSIRPIKMISYENIVRHQILYFLGFFTILKIVRKPLDLIMSGDHLTWVILTILTMNSKINRQKS